MRQTRDINHYLEQIIMEEKLAAGVQVSYWNVLAIRNLATRTVPTSKIGWYYLRRRDLVEQAVSFEKSIQSKMWHSFQGQEDQLKGLTFHAPDCIDKLRKLVSTEIHFSKLFADYGITPQPLFYEDIFANPLSALQGFAKSFDLPQPTAIPDTHLRVLRNDETQEWKLRLLQTAEVQQLIDMRPPIE